MRNLVFILMALSVSASAGANGLSGEYRSGCNIVDIQETQLGYEARTSTDVSGTKLENGRVCGPVMQGSGTYVLQPLQGSTFPVFRARANSVEGGNVMILTGGTLSFRMSSAGASFVFTPVDGSFRALFRRVR